MRTKPCIACGKDMGEICCDNCGSPDLNLFNPDPGNRQHHHLLGDRYLGGGKWVCRNCNDITTSLRCPHCDASNNSETHASERKGEFAGRFVLVAVLIALWLLYEKFGN